MPPIQLSLLLHQLLDFLKGVRITGDKLWKLSKQQVLFLRSFFRGCLSVCLSKTYGRLPSIQRDEAVHLVFDDVYCFNKFPTFFSRGQRSQSLPLHYQPEPQIGLSSSHPAVPSHPTTSTARDGSISPLGNSSITTRADDDDHKSTPPGLSTVVSDLIGVTSCEFERYERNFKTYVFNYRFISYETIGSP